MKFVSWNVNGLRACMNKGFHTFLIKWMLIFCYSRNQNARWSSRFTKNGYYYYLNSAIRKGYSGTLIYTKENLSMLHMV